MSAYIVKMPDLGEGIAEVEIVAWHVQPGDAVAEDQILADVLTDKATIEVPSAVAGRVLALGAEVGQTLAVGAELIRIEVADADVPGTAGAGMLVVPAVPVAAARSESATAPAPAVVVAPGSEPPPAPVDSASARPIASPAVRARAWDLGIDLRQVQASGTAGRIVQADLEAAAAAGLGRAPAAAPAPASAAPPGDATHAVKIVGLRRKIAQKMQESKRRIPHYSYVEEVDVTEVEALRTHLNAKWGAQRAHLTPLSFIAFAMARAVRECPQVNARLDDEAGVLTLHDGVHLGVATQTDLGLIVPVLRHAQSLDLWAMAAGIARLAEAARRGKVARDQLTGSTITVTSLGALGGIVSTPVINPPEVAIVGVNRIALRPMWRDGAVVARQMMNLSSSFDHRVVDGAVAAVYVQCVRGLLERPAMLFMA